MPATTETRNVFENLYSLRRRVSALERLTMDRVRAAEADRFGEGEVDIRRFPDLAEPIEAENATRRVVAELQRAHPMIARAVTRSFEMRRARVEPQGVNLTRLLFAVE